MIITETTFGPKTYLVLRKRVNISEVTGHDMYEAAGKKLITYITAHNLTISGKWTVIYFDWNTENMTTDLGIAFPINNLKEVNDPELSLMEIPELKASTYTLVGPYEGLAKAHQGLNVYVEEHRLRTTDVSAMALEEYIIDSMSVPDETKWQTDIYYFHK